MEKYIVKYYCEDTGIYLWFENLTEGEAVEKVKSLILKGKHHEETVVYKCKEISPTLLVKF